MEQKAFEMALAFQRGDEKGLDYFFSTLYKDLLYYAFKIMKDKPVAEDKVANSFIKIWERKESFSHPKVIKSWLYKTVRNECFNHLDWAETQARRQNGYIRFVDTVESPIEEKIILREMIREAYEAQRILPDECQKIFLMLFKQGLSAKEISTQLNISISTVKNQKGRAIDIIRKYIYEGYANTWKQQQERKKVNQVRATLIRPAKFAARNRQIIKLFNGKTSIHAIAAKFNISSARVYDIYKKRHLYDT